MENPEETPTPQSLKARLGLDCVEMPLLEMALTHRSYTFEHPELPNNERLEFLGDAVLGLVVTDMIFAWYPALPEGDLAKLRSSSVNMSVLAQAARAIGLGEELLLGRGEELSGGRDKDSILADAFEAVIGAAYLDCGLEQILRMIERLLAGHIRRQFDQGVLRDFKTSLQELAAQHLGVVPVYRVSFSGPDHRKNFEARVYLSGALAGTGQGRSKKQAEQGAAAEALALPMLDPVEPPDS
ncbi:MAG: ribonuclease III [Actinomycetota bacterium]